MKYLPPFMIILNCIIALVITSVPLMAANVTTLSDRPKDGELQHILRAAHNGYLLLQRLTAQQLPEEIVFARFTETKQTQPSYLEDDPKYKSQNDTDQPKRPQITNFKLTVVMGANLADVTIPDKMKWEELITYNGWHGPHYTPYQGLTEWGFDPFAHNGEVAFRFDISKKGREQFAGLLIVPEGWGSHIASAAAWRLENKQLFESALLAKEQLALLRTNTQSGNPLIKKMSVGLLLRDHAATAEEMKDWLRSEPSLVDSAVTVQLMLATDAKNSVVTAPAWMVAEGEGIWGGALIGATLIFAQNETAVTSMMLYHAKLRGSKGVQSDEINTLKESAKNQIGYDTIEAIGAELIKTNALRNYPMFSAANQILSATNIIDRESLFFEINAAGK